MHISLCTMKSTTFASMFCSGHGRKRTQLPLSDSILLDQRDEKPKASGEFSSNCPKRLNFEDS